MVCEGGPTLNGALVAAGLVDELCLTLAPLVAGGDSPRIVAGADGDASSTGVLRRRRSLLERGRLLFWRADVTAAELPDLSPARRPRRSVVASVEQAELASKSSSVSNPCRRWRSAGGDLVEVAQPLEHRQADSVGVDLPAPDAAGVLDLGGEPAICVGSTGRFLAAALTPATTLARRRARRSPVRLTTSSGTSSTRSKVVKRWPQSGTRAGGGWTCRRRTAGVDDLVSRPPQAGQRMRGHEYAAAGQGTGSARTWPGDRRGAAVGRDAGVDKPAASPAGATSRAMDQGVAVGDDVASASAPGGARLGQWPAEQEPTTRRRRGPRPRCSSEADVRMADPDDGAGCAAVEAEPACGRRRDAGEPERRGGATNWGER